MAEAVLQRVLGEISVLDQYELRQVQEQCKSDSSQRHASKRHAFYQALRASGLVKRIKRVRQMISSNGS